MYKCNGHRLMPSRADESSRPRGFFAVRGGRSRTAEDVGPYKPSPAEKVARHRATDEESDFVRCSIIDRGSRTVEGAGPYGFVRFSVVARGSRTVEDAGPYGWCVFRLLVVDFYRSKTVEKKKRICYTKHRTPKGEEIK